MCYDVPFPSLYCQPPPTGDAEEVAATPQRHGSGSGSPRRRNPCCPSLGTRSANVQRHGRRQDFFQGSANTIFMHHKAKRRNRIKIAKLYMQKKRQK